MSDGPREIGRAPYVIAFDDDGPVSFPLVVTVQRGEVIIGSDVEPFWRLDVDAREHFQRVFMDAGREAEAWAREHGDACDG